MSKIGLTVEQINAMEPTGIVRNDNVRDKFIQIYEAMWTPSTGTSGEAAYERESRNFNRLLSEKEDVRKTCTKFSLFTAFLDVAISGLTLDPGTKAQAYILARSVAVDSYYDNGQKKNKYETHCMLTVSGYGELVLRARCGQIRHADNPVIVYEEDSFEYGERDGQKFVNYTCRLPIDFRNGIDVMTTETTCLSSIWETDEETQKFYTAHKRPEAYKKLHPGAMLSAPM